MKETRAQGIARGRPKLVLTDVEQIRALKQLRRDQMKEAQQMAAEKKAKRLADAAKKTAGAGGPETQ